MTLLVSHFSETCITFRKANYATTLNLFLSPFEQLVVDMSDIDLRQCESEKEVRSLSFSRNNFDLKNTESFQGNR